MSRVATVANAPPVATRFQNVFAKLAHLTTTTQQQHQDTVSPLLRAYACMLEPDDIIYLKAYNYNKEKVRFSKEQGFVPFAEIQDYFTAEREAYPEVKWGPVFKMFQDTQRWIHGITNRSATRKHHKFSRARKSTTVVDNSRAHLTASFQRSRVRTLPREVIAKLAMFATTPDALMILQSHVHHLRDILVDAEFWVCKLRTDMALFRNATPDNSFYAQAYANFYSSLPGNNKRPHQNALVARRRNRTRVETYPVFAQFRVLFAATINNTTWWQSTKRQQQVSFHWPNMYWLIYVDAVLTCLIASMYFQQNPNARPSFSNPCPYRMAWPTFAENMAAMANTGVPLIDSFLLTLPTVEPEQRDDVNTMNGSTILLQFSQAFVLFIKQTWKRLRLPGSFGL